MDDRSRKCRLSSEIGDYDTGAFCSSRQNSFDVVEGETEATRIANEKTGDGDV